METDYREIGMSIAEAIGKVTKPLARDQKLFLVGAMSPWLKQRDDRIDELEKQVEQLQLALAFWLPSVPAEGDLYIINRIGDHAMLLGGLNAEPEQSAQDRGWITLDASE